MFNFTERQELLKYIKDSVKGIKEKEMYKLELQIDTLMVLHCFESVEDREYFRKLYNLVLVQEGFNYNLDTIKEKYSKEKYREHSMTSSYSYHDPIWCNEDKCWYVRDYDCDFHAERFVKVGEI